MEPFALPLICGCHQTFLVVEAAVFACANCAWKPPDMLLLDERQPLDANHRLAANSTL